MFSITFMDPRLFWLGVPLVLLTGLAMAWYGTKAIEGARKFYGDQVLLDLFSPKNTKQTIGLWAQWILLFIVLVVAAAGPNASNTPQMAQAGALQVAVVYDVSNSMGAEDYRPYLKPALGGTVPSSMYQWGTRLDQAKQIMKNDFLPQLKDNEVGLFTVIGKGYNMWDLTRDHGGALKYMHDKFVQVGAAPGGGADYTSGIQAALDEFKLIGGKDKERFIVLFGDGGFTGDKEELNKVLQILNKEKIHLLMVGVGGPAQITVPKYDAKTKQRNGAYDGTTKYEPEIFEHMKTVVSGSTILLAPPGTEHLSYNFPAKAGGLYAVPSHSNLYPWMLLFAMLILVSITTGGGGLPKWHLTVALVKNPYKFVRDKFKRN